MYKLLQLVKGLTTYVAVRALFIQMKLPDYFLSLAIAWDPGVIFFFYSTISVQVLYAFIILSFRLSSMYLAIALDQTVFSSPYYSVLSKHIFSNSFGSKMCSYFFPLSYSKI